MRRVTGAVGVIVISSVLVSCFFVYWKSHSSFSAVSEESDLRSIVSSLNLTDVAILDNQTIEMPSISEFSILFIDGVWLRNSLNMSGLTYWISSAIVSGRPTFIFEGEPDIIVDLAGSSVREVYGSTPIAGGCFCSEGKPEFDFIFRTNLSKEVVEEAHDWATGRIQE